METEYPTCHLAGGAPARIGSWEHACRRVGRLPTALAVWGPLLSAVAASSGGTARDYMTKMSLLLDSTPVLSLPNVPERFNVPFFAVWVDGKKLRFPYETCALALRQFGEPMPFWQSGSMM